jgi:hypothetical protein
MQYEIYVLPIDEVNRVGLSHCTNDRRHDDKRESLDREHRRGKVGKIFCLSAARFRSVFISHSSLSRYFLFHPSVFERPYDHLAQYHSLVIGTQKGLCILTQVDIQPNGRGSRSGRRVFPQSEENENLVNMEADVP